MAVITTSSFAKALWPGVNSWWGDAYSTYTGEWPMLFDSYTSKQQYEEDVGRTGFGLAVVKTEGGSIQYDDESQAWLTRYTHVTYGKGFIITREMYEDSQYPKIGQKRAQNLSFAINQTMETLGANIYNRAFNSSYTGGDGTELCATDHSLWSGGTWQNEPTTAADLSEAALEQAYIDIGNWVNERSLKIKVMPKTLIIPLNLTFEAERILTSVKRVGTADNDPNALRQMNIFPGGVVVNHYLTDTDAWFVRTNLPSDGMKYWSRRPVEFSIDNDFDTENAKFKATFRCSFGWTDARGVYGSPGA